MEDINTKMDYVEFINNNFPYTLFVWTFKKLGSETLIWTKPKTYSQINKLVFWKKHTHLRTTIFNSTSDELRLDFDYPTISENIREVSKVLKKLNSLGLNKYLLYFTGGKGLNLHLRFSFDFEEFDRQDIRSSLWESLNLNCNIDKTLFRTQQVIGLECCKHRKTGINKQLVNIEDEKLIFLNKSLDFNYLTESFVNTIPNDLKQTMINILNTEPNPIKNTIFDNTPPVFYNNTTFNFHFNRFLEIYSNLKDGRRRTLDMFSRYIFLTTKSEELTYYYYKLFTDRVGFNHNNKTIKLKVDNTILSMRANAIFIYKDVFTKEFFYSTYNKL